MIHVTRGPHAKIEQIETTALEMPYTKPLVTATNNFTVARGVLVNAVNEQAKMKREQVNENN